ncbi:MAG: hypothetical protein Q9N34_09095 [Aquificota bacterium]|nr:hypothetical protein [Aquificota bacterium]
MIFFGKSDLEKRAEKGDKSAILDLVRKGKVKKAIKILERFREEKDLRKVLFDLYLKEGMYKEAHRLIREFGREVGTARERGLVCEKVGDVEGAVEEYSKGRRFRQPLEGGRPA